MGLVFSSVPELAKEIERLRAEGKKVAFANGCFDLLHVGHIRYLKAAREHAHALICAINSDASMERIKPGRKPVYPEAERYEIVASFACVDYVIPIVEDTPISIIASIQPEVHCKGTDYTVDRLPERETIEAYGGAIKFVGGPKVRNTSDTLEELKDR